LYRARSCRILSKVLVSNGSDTLRIGRNGTKAETIIFVFHREAVLGCDDPCMAGLAYRENAECPAMCGLRGNPSLPRDNRGFWNQDANRSLFNPLGRDDQHHCFIVAMARFRPNLIYNSLFVLFRACHTPLNRRTLCTRRSLHLIFPNVTLSQRIVLGVFRWRGPLRKGTIQAANYEHQEGSRLCAPRHFGPPSDPKGRCSVASCVITCRTLPSISPSLLPSRMAGIGPYSDSLTFRTRSSTSSTRPKSLAGIARYLSSIK